MGSLVVELKADLARLQTDMNRGVGVVEKAALGITKAAGVAKAALAGIAGGLTAGAFASTIKQAIDFGDSLRDTARAAGQTVEQMAFLDYAATQSGTSIQSLTTVTAKLQKTLSEVVKGGNQKAASAIAQLGLDAQELAQAEAIGADFVVISPVRATPSHPLATPIGWNGSNTPDYSPKSGPRKSKRSPRRSKPTG